MRKQIENHAGLPDRPMSIGEVLELEFGGVLIEFEPSDGSGKERVKLIGRTRVDQVGILFPFRGCYRFCYMQESGDILFHRDIAGGKAEAHRQVRGWFS